MYDPTPNQHYDWSQDTIAADKALATLSACLTNRDWTGAKEAATEIVVLSRRIWVHAHSQLGDKHD